MSLQPQAYVHQGANQGLGLIIARLLASSTETSNHVILTSRSLQKANQAITTLTTAHGFATFNISALELDVTSSSSIAAAAAQVQSIHGGLDILINNAGISPKTSSASENAALAFATNVTGAIAVTEAFLPLLRQSSNARLIYLSSDLGSINKAADPTDRFYEHDVAEYRASKAAINMLAARQAKTLKADGVKVWAVDPGFRATAISGDAERARKGGAGEPEDGAKVVVDVVEGKRDGQVGLLVHEGGVWPW